MDDLVGWHREMLDAQARGHRRLRDSALEKRKRAMHLHPVGSTFDMLGSKFTVIKYGNVDEGYGFSVTVTYKNTAGEVRQTTWKSSQFPICEWAGEPE